MQSFLIEKQAEIAEICRRHHVARLFVFGSAARQDFDPARSDVDLLVEFEQGYRPKSRWMRSELADELEETFAYKVELALVGSIRNPYVLKTVEEDRRLLYAA